MNIHPKVLSSRCVGVCSVYYFWAKKPHPIENKRSRASLRASPSLLHHCPSKGSGVRLCGHSAVTSPEPPSRRCPLPPSARARCGPAARRDWHPCRARCLFRARRAQSGPAACSFPAGLQEAPPLSFLYMSRWQQALDSPPPFDPAALDLPLAAAPRPGPMRGTGSRFGLSLLLPPIAPPPAAISLFLHRSSLLLLCLRLLREESKRGDGCAWLGGARGRLCGQTYDAGAWNPYLPESYLPVISQKGEKYSVPVCEWAVCACVFCTHVPVVIWRHPRWAE